MQLIRDDLNQFEGESVLTIGKFDGLHLGHQRLVESLRARAEGHGVRSVLVTFDPHPAAVLNPAGAPPLLTTLDEKAQLLATWGLDTLVLLTFDHALMQTRAADFLERLATGLRPRELWVGADFALGYKREGDVAFIRAWSADRGLAVHPVPLVEVEGEVVSGARIRALLTMGAVAEAAALLGRLPTVRGQVQRGDQRGRTIGVPTANLRPLLGYALPADGVYATWAQLPSGERVASVTNVGTRPTFAGQARQVECHLFEWEGDLYGETLTVHFVHRLRAEQKFSGIEALVAQIRRDSTEARVWLDAAGDKEQ